jgi:general secretion pathway protein H
MLAVMLIMGLCIGLVSVIARPDDRALLRNETERLAQLLDLAAVQARLTGKRIAWTGTGAGYRFWQLDAESGWSDVREGDLSSTRTLPYGMRIAGLQVENMGAQESLRLVFTPYATGLAFTIEMVLGAERYAVVASPVGEVQVVAGTGVPNGKLAR